MAMAQVSYADTAYEALFPYYVMACGSTQETSGNAWGHAVTYLKGVCRERVPPADIEVGKKAPAPWKLKICSADDLSEDVSLAGEAVQKGIFLSANARVANSHWIAVPGRNLGLSGGLPATASLDAKFHEQLLKRIVDLGVYSGLQLHSSSQRQFEVRDFGESLDHYLAEYALTSDYGLTLGREVKCWKIPVNIKQMSAIVTWANKINEEVYFWDAIQSNCNHFVVNILAAAKLMKPMPKGLKNLLSLTHLSPASTLTRIAKKVQAEIPTVDQVFKRPHLKDSLIQFGQLPFQYGVVFETFDFHSFGNVEFVENSEAWGCFGAAKCLKAIDQNKNLTQFDQALNRYYEKILAARKTFESRTLLDRLSDVSKSGRDEYSRIHSAYERWLAETENELVKALHQLTTAKIS